MMEYDKLDQKSREKYMDKMLFDRMGCTRCGMLGQGAFSDVYCVEEAFGGRQYACKVSSHVDMLEKEAMVMAKLHHPLFPEYISFQETVGLGILFREYVPGSCLKELLERRRFSAGQTVRAGMELAEGLQYLHGRPERFLFRDIKPANIIVRQDGKIRLIDFGCVCSREEGFTSRAGSPGYAAPEQLQDGGILTEACDVYGLGQTLKEMLGKNSRCPPGRIRGVGCLKRMRLRRILDTCTEEDAAGRPADMDEVWRKLLRLHME